MKNLLDGVADFFIYFFLDALREISLKELNVTKMLE